MRTKATWIAVCAAFALVALTTIGVALMRSDGDGDGDHRTVVPNVARSASAADSPTATPTAITPTATTSKPSPTPTLTGTPQALETVELEVSDGERSKTITVQVADDSRERQVGLMWVTELPEDEGMLFVFADEHSGGFWMRNTYIPLDIAYIGSDGTVLEVHQGAPLDETTIRPGQPYRYTLEMNAGWFERNGFEPGSATVTIPASVGG